MADIADLLNDSVVLSNNRKLKAIWSMDMAQDLKAMHNIDINNELAEIMAAAVDEEIINSLVIIAGDGVNIEHTNNDIIITVKDDSQIKPYVEFVRELYLD